MPTIGYCRSTSRCGRFQTMVCAAAVFLGKLIGWLALAVLPMLLFAATATATAAGQVQPEPTIELASLPLVKLPETIKQPLALECDFRAASKLAEQIRVAVTKHAIELSASETMSYTISIGLTEVLLGKEQIDDAIHRADLALYSAKKAGRNRVEARA